MNTEPLLRIDDLRVTFTGPAGAGPAGTGPGGPVLAVGGVSLDLREDEVLAVVGESGSGKTVTGLSVLGLEPAAATVTGSVWFRGEDLRQAPAKRLRDLRGAEIAMIFQEPMTSLNPSLTVGRQVSEVLRRHQGLSGAKARTRVAELFELVRLPEPARHLSAYPHQLSGGMRQRVMIAMAIACDPAVLIADEPTTALDPTIQAQIIDLLGELRAALRMSVLLVTHNLGLVKGFADRVLVMYAGQVLEEATASDLLGSPRHPYTAGLIGAVPRPGANRRSGRLTPIPGQVPVLRAEPDSCVFSPRCPYVHDACLTAQPALRPPNASAGPSTSAGTRADDSGRGQPQGHLAACVLDELPGAPVMSDTV